MARERSQRVFLLLAAPASAIVALAMVGALAYLTFVLLLGRLPRTEERGTAIAGVAAAVVVAASFTPLRSRAARLLLRSAKPSAGEVLRDLPSRLTRAIPLDELLLQVAEAMAASLELGSVEVWVKRGRTFERVAAVPHQGPGTVEVDPTEELAMAQAHRRGTAWVRIWMPHLSEPGEDTALLVLPLVDAGDVLGFIRAGKDGAFGSDEEDALVELARTLALALRNATLDAALEASLREVQQQAEELRRSRARIVAAADAERRRIERNIHDGVQQQIVALLSKLGLAEGQLRRAPAEAEPTLAELKGDARRLLEDLRDLAHGIHPSVLTDQGLLDAVEAQASRSPIGIAIEAPNGLRGRRFPAEIEGAAFFVIAESLANVLKHARARHATVRLAATERNLTVEIVDDGDGFDPSSADGSGLTGLHDRIEAVGGSMRIESAPSSGTVVTAHLPIGGNGP